jgi:hypothetical protein
MKPCVQKSCINVKSMKSYEELIKNRSNQNELNTKYYSDLIKYSVERLDNALAHELPLKSNSNESQITNDHLDFINENGQMCHFERSAIIKYTPKLFNQRSQNYPRLDLQSFKISNKLKMISR